MTLLSGKSARAALRTCLGCGLRDEQNHLIRLRVRDDGGLSADENRTGRGGYLHHGRECWKKFVKRKSLYRAFHTEIAREIKEALVQELKDRYGD
jgi:predicted RNA-binding protein YlxR (DUF448 family)